MKCSTGEKTKSKRKVFAESNSSVIAINLLTALKSSLTLSFVSAQRLLAAEMLLNSFCGLFSWNKKQYKLKEKKLHESTCALCENGAILSQIILNP